MAASASANHELVASIDDLHIGIGERHSSLLESVREFDARGLFRSSGCRDTAEWLAGRYGWSTFKARRVVASSHAIASLPHVQAALRSGRLDLDRVLELTRMATPDTEKDLIRWARRVTVAAIRQRADLHRAKAPRETKRNDKERYLEGMWDEPDMMTLYGRMPAEVGRMTMEALDRLADQVPVTTGDISARRVDALAALCSQSLLDGPGEKPHMVVHTDLAALASKTQCSSAGDQVIHPEIARRLSCDARMQIVLHDDSGEVRAISTPHYNVPSWLREQVLHRDGYRCTFPGCHMRRFVDIHHVIPWPKGPTSLDNLVTACRFHHKLVHELAWIVLLRDGVVEWRRPNGDVFDPSPVGARAGPDPDL